METSDDIDRRIKATRRRKLIEFIDSRESQVEASAELGYEPGYISQLKMNGHRGIGEGVARFMERNAGLPMFWFDDIVIDAHLTPQEQQLIEKYRLAPVRIQTATEAILDGYARQPSDTQADIDTIAQPALTDKKAS
jgi:hypothetical protein